MNRLVESGGWVDIGNVTTLRLAAGGTMQGARHAWGAGAMRCVCGVWRRCVVMPVPEPSVRQYRVQCHHGVFVVPRHRPYQHAAQTWYANAQWRGASSVVASQQLGT